MTTAVTAVARRVDPGQPLVAVVEQPAHGLAAPPGERDRRAEHDHDAQRDQPVARFPAD
jgi:hypothetical protein